MQAKESMSTGAVKHSVAGGQRLSPVVSPINTRSREFIGGTPKNCFGS
jgi:hypothetical protein